MLWMKGYLNIEKYMTQVMIWFNKSVFFSKNSWASSKYSLASM